MSSRSVEHFEAEIDRVVEYFRREYKMTLAEAVGTLQIVAMRLGSEALQESPE